MYYPRSKRSRPLPHCRLPTTVLDTITIEVVSFGLFGIVVLLLCLCCLCVVHGFQRLMFCETPFRQKNIEAHLKKHLECSSISHDDISKLVTEIIGTNVSEAFTLIYQLETLKEKTTDPTRFKKAFEELRYQFLLVRTDRVCAALGGDLGKITSPGRTVSRMAIIQTMHAVFETLQETTPSGDPWWNCQQVMYTEVFKRVSLQETEFIDAMEALARAKVIRWTKNTISACSPGYITAYKRHSRAQKYMILRAQADRESKKSSSWLGLCFG